MLWWLALKRAPMMERITIAKQDMTMLERNVLVEGDGRGVGGGWCTMSRR